MRCFYHTSNTVNLIAATKYTTFGIIEYCIFVKDLVDCGATTQGVVFAKYVAQITKQQGRYAIGHRVLQYIPYRRSRATRPWPILWLLSSPHSFCNFGPRVSESSIGNDKRARVHQLPMGDFPLGRKVGVSDK